MIKLCALDVQAVYHDHDVMIKSREVGMKKLIKEMSVHLGHPKKQPVYLLPLFRLSEIKSKLHSP